MLTNINLKMTCEMFPLQYEGTVTKNDINYTIYIRHRSGGLTIYASHDSKYSDSLCLISNTKPIIDIDIDEPSYEEILKYIDESI